MVSEKEIEAAIKAIEAVPIMNDTYNLSGEDAKAVARAALEAAACVRAEADANGGDRRPADCRFRLQEEGKPYPRSGCRACGAGILSGLRCPYAYNAPQPSGTVEALADALRGLLKAYENAFDWSAELPPETVEAERIANEVLHSLASSKPEQETVDSVAREMLATLKRARKLMPSYSGYFSYILDEMDDIIAKAERVLGE